jgi:transcriptional regulator with XRE-family HTH domain
MPRRPLHAHPAPFKTVNELLDAIKARFDCPSERKLAQLMDWSPSQLRNYRKGRSRPADAEAMEIARKLNVDDGMVVAICHAEREENAQVKAMWLHLAKQLSRIVGPALAVGFIALAPPPAHASTGADAGGVYIMLD